MGRRSRAIRERRMDPMLRAMRHGLKAERRGKAIPPTRDAYETLARSPRGPRAVQEAVISRHNQRFMNMVGVARSEIDDVVSTLHIVPALDTFLLHHGVSLRAHPPNPYGTVADHLRWGLDSACVAMRFLLAGNPIGAAVIARTQLERWTEHLGRSRGVARAEDESTTDWHTRVWAFPDGLRDLYVGIWGPGGSTDRPAGDTWVDLSEALHGRGPLMAGVRWEAAQVADSNNLHELASTSAAVHHAVRLSLSHIRTCLVVLARDGSAPKGLLANLQFLPFELPARYHVEVPVPLLWPLNGDHLGSFAQGAANVVESYDDVLSAGYDGDYTAGAVTAFVNRRARAHMFGIAALDAEAQSLGEGFDVSSIARREQGYVLINEIAGLLSAWGQGPTADALAAGSAALRASLWLWLEDDDRAMVAARTVLEQTARLRTWRLKPAKAALLEARAQTTPRDWLEEAGWRRLSVLNRSLGEYSHASMRARWAGAHNALTELGRVDDSGHDPRLTARGDALNDVALAFGVEVHEHVASEGPELAAAFAEVLPLGDGAAEDVERWLDRCWAKRSISFGNPDFGLTAPGRDHGLTWRAPSERNEISAGDHGTT